MEGVFVGYSKRSKAFRISIPEIRKTVTARDVNILFQPYYTNHEE